MFYIYANTYLATGKKVVEHMFLKKSRVILSCAIISTVALTTVISSCKKNNDDDGDAGPAVATTFAEEQALIEQIYSNTDRLVERAFTLGQSALKGGENPLGVCAFIKEEETDDPSIDRMIIEFGGTPCLGYDGRYRSGRLIIDYTKNATMKEKGSYHKITFDNYVLEGYRVGGHKEVWNTGRNASNEIEYVIASVDTVYTDDNSGRMTGASERKRSWFMGESTPQTSDDVYLLTGFGNFISTSKNSYQVKIAKPLVDAYDCNWIKEGVTDILPEGLSKRVLDFGGDGSCDDKASINTNGVIREVDLP